MRLKLHFFEGSQVNDCMCHVERRGIAGPDGERKFWLVRTDLSTFVSDLPPTEFLIIGPGGQESRLETIEDKIINSVVIQAMLDLTGHAPNIDSFNWPSVYYFAKRDRNQGRQLIAAENPITYPPTGDDVVDYADANNGNAQPGYKGGTDYENDGRGNTTILHETDESGNPVTYKEYDTNPYMAGVNRGPERVVIGSDGSAYYTSDHYQTFTTIR